MANKQNLTAALTESITRMVEIMLENRKSNEAYYTLTLQDMSATKVSDDGNVVDEWALERVSVGIAPLMTGEYNVEPVYFERKRLVETHEKDENGTYTQEVFKEISTEYKW